MSSARKIPSILAASRQPPAASHHAHRLPVLQQHSTDVALLVKVIGDLGQSPPPDINEIFERHHGNIRWCLRELDERAADAG